MTAARPILRRLLAAALLALSAPASFAAPGEPSLLGNGSAGDLLLVRRGNAAPVHVPATDWPGVQRATCRPTSNA